MKIISPLIKGKETIFLGFLRDIIILRFCFNLWNEDESH